MVFSQAPNLEHIIFFFSSRHVHLFVNSAHKEILSSVREKEIRVYEVYQLYAHIPKLYLF